MADEQKPKLFREKSLEAIDSPEALNDYLRVTSPGVWLVLTTVVVLLAGAIVWSVFGRIETTTTLAVQSEDGATSCYVPYDILDQVVKRGSVSVRDHEYRLKTERNIKVTVISAETNPVVLVVGNLQEGEMTVEVPVDAKLAEGVYEGKVVTESLQPISLLLQ